MEAFVAELLSLAEATKVPLEVCDGFVRLLEAGAEIFTLKADCLSAPVADHLVVRLELTDLALRFMATCRTGHPDLGIIEQSLGHISPP